MTAPPKPKLSLSQWDKTPYARTSTQDPDREVRRLLEKYGVKSLQWTEGEADGRPRIHLRFLLDDHRYRISMTGLDAPVDHDALVRQLKRAIFWTLKPLLEGAKVFFDAEQVLLGFLEMDNGATMYEVAQKRLPTTAKGVADLLALPGPREH